MIITAPASTANLGPGFDALALALDLNFSLCLNEQPRGGAWEPAREDHIAIIAYRAAGGVTPIEKMWTQSHIPYARGLGFSGAARVAGAYAAYIQNGETEFDARDLAFRTAGDLESSDDNASASTYGGFCVTTAGHVMRFDCEPQDQGLSILMFVPEQTSSTEKTRGLLPEDYSKQDVVTSLGNVALLTAMLASNTFNDEVLNIVMNDVVHQPYRFGASDISRTAYECFQSNGAIAQWLSGAGSSVAAIVAEEKCEDIKNAIEKLELGCAFQCMELNVSNGGVHEVQQ